MANRPPLLRWKTLNTQIILDRAPWLRVHAEDVRLPDGRVVEGYLRLEMPDYVMIVPVLPDGRIGFIRSYKRGVDDVDMQPPAGLIEAGEEPLHTAQRELMEETGCQADHWASMGAFIIGGNMRGGTAHLYLATGCRQVAKPDPGDLEEQEVVWMDASEARRLWRASEFVQMSTAAALGLAFARLSPGDEPTPPG